MLTPKLLADGQLPNAKATIYTVPASSRALIKSLILVNGSGSDKTVNLYINGSGASRRIIPKDTLLKSGYSLEVDSTPLLSAGNTLEGDASSAASVDYTITGVVES